MMKRKKFVVVLLAISFSCSFMFSSPTQVHAEFPEKPIEMTILFGGTANAIGHLLSDLMGKSLGQPVVAVSRTGAGGAVGYTYCAAAPADGYNMVFNSNSISTASHRGNLDCNYTAFDAVARVSTEVPVLGVNTKKGWKNLEDFKVAALDSKHKMKVGISGRGSFTHLASAMLFDSMGLSDKIIYVPYGEGKAPAELLAGRVDAALQWPGQFKSYVDAGQLNVLTVTSAERIKLLPQVPTAKEQGYDVDITMWRGLAVPKGTPNDRVLKLQNAAKEAIASDRFQQVADEVGFNPAYMPMDEFAALIAKDDEIIGKKLEELGMKK